VTTTPIGTPGAISPATGLIKNANSTCLNGRPLLEDLEQELGRPLRLANDANCFALSEATDGAAAGCAVVFGAILGTGVGGGVVVNGQPLIGVNAIGGEWGHNSLPDPGEAERPGPECYCGHRGCIESWLSGPGMAADHERHGGGIGGGLSGIDALYRRVPELWGRWIFSDRVATRLLPQVHGDASGARGAARL